MRGAAAARALHCFHCTAVHSTAAHIPKDHAATILSNTSGIDMTVFGECYMLTKLSLSSALWMMKRVRSSRGLQHIR